MTFKQRVAVFKALGNPARLRIVDALQGSECCVCDLVKAAGLGWAAVSRHLAVLKEAGIVEDEKRGRQVFYRMKLGCIDSVNRCLDGNSCACNRKGR